MTMVEVTFVPPVYSVWRITNGIYRGGMQGTQPPVAGPHRVGLGPVAGVLRGDVRQPLRACLVWSSSDHRRTVLNCTRLV
jgi:hypothetical protein